MTPDAWQAEFMQRVGAIGELGGLPPSHVQVLAWLVVCEPPEQSADQLRQALALSAGAVSMATGALMRLGLVERMAQPGHRRLSYRIHPNGWPRLLRLGLEDAAQLRALADEALSRAPSPPDRLVQLRDVYAWVEDHVAALLTQLPPSRRQRDHLVRGRASAVPSTARSTRSL